jgi:acetylornithine deacetylase/succinyl-diaminopimelate desuccinylase-like protein
LSPHFGDHSVQLGHDGARGVTGLAITVYGANRGLRSGHYGNGAPNPAMMLAQLLAGMKDKTGHVLIPHFYDGITPLTPLEKQAVAEAPNNGPMLRKEFALGHTDGDGKTLVELLNEPSLNIDGFAAADVGAQHTNVIPSTATVDNLMRLVKGLDWKTQQQRVVDYITSQGYFRTSSPPDNRTLMSHPYGAFVQLDDGYNAVRTPMDLPIAQEVIAAVERACGPVVKLPTMGGSVTLEVIEKTLGTQTITVPIANYDNNQHSANENIRIQNLWNGIETHGRAGVDGVAKREANVSQPHPDSTSGAMPAAASSSFCGCSCAVVTSATAITTTAEPSAMYTSMCSRSTSHPRITAMIGLT